MTWSEPAGSRSSKGSSAHRANCVPTKRLTNAASIEGRVSSNLPVINSKLQRPARSIQRAVDPITLRRPLACRPDSDEQAALKCDGHRCIVSHTSR
jgi:hypothetical protein